jgi:hypothetical protein
MVNPYRVLLKALLLFLAANLLFGLVETPRLGRISVYNGLFPGRPRFPFGEAPREAYNFSLFDLDAMFASHEISRPKLPDERRVVVIGDSSVWGTLLRPEESLVGQLNELAAQAETPARYYNLGYPTLSLTKDLMILERARAYDPDLVVWLVTLESFPRDKQLAVPLVEANPSEALAVVARYRLGLEAARLRRPGLWERTIVGRRKDLADLLRLQIYGVLWAATGIDQLYPLDYPRAQIDLEPDPHFHGQERLRQEDLLYEGLSGAQAGLGTVPLLVVNEPILISSGLNSEIRYNFYYPRQAYDQYRAWLAKAAGQAGYVYVDAWDLVPAGEFTNSAIHLDRQGTARLAGRISEAVLEALE